MADAKTAVNVSHSRDEKADMLKNDGSQTNIPAQVMITEVSEGEGEGDNPPRRDFTFWMIFVALSLCTMLSALDLGGVATAAPTIVGDLNSADFTWVGSAYSLSSAACIPLAGNLAEIFGRRPVVLIALFLFAIGSAMAGAAPTMAILVGGRAIQGVGGGGITSLTSIIISDLVPLRERGIYTGITGFIWTLGSAAGPFIAGAFAEDASWRWLFYLNLPLTAAAFVVVLIFLRLRSPRESLWEKTKTVDWFGNFLIITSATSCMLALTWGGVKFPWTSPRILAPLILGALGLAAAMYYESRWPVKPTIPMAVLNNRTSLCGYLASVLQGVISYGLAFYLPTWFQAVKAASPIKAGGYYLAMHVSVSPCSIIQGIIVARTGRYRLLTIASWAVLLLGVGLLISIKRTTPIGVVIVYELLIGIGTGFSFAATFAVLAPLPVSQNGPAISLLTFLKVFSQAWGIALGGVILQNTLQDRVPQSLVDSLPKGSQIAYTIIPTIPSLPEAVKIQVTQAFLESMRYIWITWECLCALGFFCFFVMKDVPLRKTIDKSWGIDKEKKMDEEVPSSSTSRSEMENVHSSGRQSDEKRATSEKVMVDRGA